jgi:hypothetical protein
MNIKIVLYSIAAVLSLGISIICIINNALPNFFMPFAIFCIAVLMTTNAHGVLKGALAQSFIATGGILTGLFIGNSPIFIPGIQYFLLGVSLPLAIIAALDFKTYFSILKGK